MCQGQTIDHEATRRAFRQLLAQRVECPTEDPNNLNVQSRSTQLEHPSEAAHAFTASYKLQHETFDGSHLIRYIGRMQVAQDISADRRFWGGIHKAQRTTTIAQTRNRAGFEVERLGLIACFVAVAERGSFVAAGSAVDASASTVSRKVARLETLLGTRLFERTTRRVSLTEAGQIYHQKCHEIFDLVADADATVAVLASAPRGALRISVPFAFGRRTIAPLMPAFLHRYPQIRARVDFTDRFVNLIEEGYDAAVRIGNLSDTSYVARKLSVTQSVLVASPLYLSRFGTPNRPDDLARLDCACVSRTQEATNVWSFQRNGAPEYVHVSGTMLSDSVEGVFEAVLQGCGIGLIPRYICADTVRSGELVALLPDWTSLSEAVIQIVYPSRRYLPPKTQVFLDYMSEHLVAAGSRRRACY